MDDRVLGDLGYGPDAAGKRSEPSGAAQTVRQPAPALSRERTRRRLRAPLLMVGVALLLAAVAAFYLHGGRFETTDDAFLQAGQASGSRQCQRVCGVRRRG